MGEAKSLCLDFGEWVKVRWCHFKIEQPVGGAWVNVEMYGKRTGVLTGVVLESGAINHRRGTEVMDNIWGQDLEVVRELLIQGGGDFEPIAIVERPVDCYRHQWHWAPESAAVPAEPPPKPELSHQYEVWKKRFRGESTC